METNFSLLLYMKNVIALYPVLLACSFCMSPRYVSPENKARPSLRLKLGLASFHHGTSVGLIQKEARTAGYPESIQAMNLVRRLNYINLSRVIRLKFDIYV